MRCTNPQGGSARYCKLAESPEEITADGREAKEGICELQYVGECGGDSSSFSHGFLKDNLPS